MCGIAGVAHSNPKGVSLDALRRMASAIRHRGPDGYGFFADSLVGLAHVQLAIVDLGGGAQPIGSEDGSVVVICNGEILNHRELRDQLSARGHTFRTRSDTEVLAHGWEEWGEGMMPRLNGQFAVAVYDRRTQVLFLARDRFGVRPLFYAERDRSLYFASEAKGIFASRAVTASPDPIGLDQVFTFWAARPPRTVFAGVSQLAPGTSLRWKHGSSRLRQWYSVSFGDWENEPHDAIEQLDELLTSSTELRLPPDVPFGGYLSGGLDSSIVCALAARGSGSTLKTFSVTFADTALDESAPQQAVVAEIGSRHSSQRIDARDITDSFVPVISHVESPILRSAPVAMFLLGRLTRSLGATVVLSGEGADEAFLGYDLFKEDAVRRFCLRQPSSSVRPRLFDRLYPYVRRERGGDFWRHFFLTATDTCDPLFSHLPRFNITRWIRHFYSDAMRESIAEFDALEELRGDLPEAFDRWAPAHKAAYLEVTTLLGPYLLSAQGDRVGMASAVEARYPFLDHRLFEFAARLPVRSKLCGLKDKEILRRWAAHELPASVASRAKRPFQAPDAGAFLTQDASSLVNELTRDEIILASGYFRSESVRGLIRRCRSGHQLGARENQALIGVLSTQSWHETFFVHADVNPPLPVDGADVLMGPAMHEQLRISSGVAS